MLFWHNMWSFWWASLGAERSRAEMDTPLKRTTQRAERTDIASTQSLHLLDVAYKMSTPKAVGTANRGRTVLDCQIGQLLAGLVYLLSRARHSMLTGIM